jgi:hypothetical protein
MREVTELQKIIAIHVLGRKRLKIPKRESESVNRGRTDNTMAKSKSTRGQTTIYKTLHRKLKIE